MAKRFTDSDKWENPWYRKLPSALREFWNYLLDRCDASGIWRVDFELAEAIIGTPLNRDSVFEAFKEKIVILDHDKWFIPSFIEFQYGVLNSQCKPHQSVIRSLTKHKIDPTTLRVNQELGNPLLSDAKTIETLLHSLKEKEKDKDKDKDKEKIRELLRNSIATFKQLYPEDGGAQ